MVPSSDRRQHLDRQVLRELRPGPTGQRPSTSSLSSALNAAPSTSASAQPVEPARSPRRQPSSSPDPMPFDDDQAPDFPPDPPALDGRRQPQSQSDDVPWLRLFMLLILWLSCARGLSKGSAGIILSFLSDVLLPGHNVTVPRHIDTVRGQIGHETFMTKYAICPNDACQACWIATLAPQHCDHCATPIFRLDNITRPKRYFHYSSVIQFLKGCFRDPALEQLINHWRRRPRGTLSDVYDGSAWTADGFTNNRLHLYLSIGVDWFLPHSFSNTASYTIGVVSVRIENLPHSMRNRPEFMLVAAILPGPRQTAEVGLNAALEPLISELKKLDEGVDIQTPAFPLARSLRARVLMALGDTPARAKLGGFPSHTQHGQWCGHCHADTSSWVQSLMRQEAPALRNPDSHRSAAFIVKASPAVRDETLRTSAATWTAFYDLPYWRSVTDVPVDAMHALHLGACKRFWHATLIEGHLLPTQRPIVTEVIASASYPRNVTSIQPTFGTTSGGSPTSDTWSTFTRFLLPLVLASHWSQAIVNDDTREFWMTHKYFRDAGLPPGTATQVFRKDVHVKQLVLMAADLGLMTHIVQSRQLTADRVTQLERLVHRHISATATNIDPRWMVSNHHALTHLPEHIRRFGPPRQFWFYSMERLNGFLKRSIHNEHHHGELEFSMMANHEMFRTVRRHIRDLGDTAEEKIFKKLLMNEKSQLDPFEAGFEDQPPPQSDRAALEGKGIPALLEPRIVNAVTLMVNDTRSARDPVAVPEFRWNSRRVPEQDEPDQMMIVSMATAFPSISLRSTSVSPPRSRINEASGGSHIIVSTNTGDRPARLLAAFEHTHSNTQSGELVTRAYAEVELFRTIQWPVNHVLAAVAPPLGYFLYSILEPETGVFPLANVVDTYVSATAKYIVDDDDAMFAARLHP